jgi:thiol-disulfide isomerase/thioredoxin
VQSSDDSALRSLDFATTWLNSEPLTAAGLRGRVVLIDFWTYTCINWLRSLPYVRAWSEKYAGQGLVTVGVHAPEFEFEQDLDNVRRAAADMDVSYPIVIDNEYAIWRAFGNHYWPALYLVDAQGRVRHHHFGEGAYEQSERVIQELLSEAGTGTGGDGLVDVEGVGAEAPADWASLRSAENYLGYGRTENFASPGGVAPDGRTVYSVPDPLRVEHWALAGTWTVGSHATVLDEADGRIAYRFHARDLHLVMGPPGRGSAVRFRALLDGEPPGADHGVDIDAEGHGTVTEQRMHQLVRQHGDIEDRTFEITFLEPGVELYVFTFG